jgi:NitT/TauT family transport system substrate-binding protein
MKRRHALAALAVACASVPAVRVRAAGTTLRVLGSPGDSSGTVFYAQDRGYFAKAGLDVQVDVMANGGVIVPAVVGGAAQIGGTSVTTLALAHQRGVALMAISPTAVYSDRAPTSELLVPKDSPLRTARDLAGKTIAVNGLNTNSHIATMAWIDKNGGNSKDSKYVEFVYSEMVPALAESHVDAALVIEPTLTLAKKVGRVFALAYDAIAPRFYLGANIARADWLAANPDVAKRFVDAMAAAADWANGHHRDSLPIVARYLKLEPGTLAGMTRAIYAGHLEASLMQPVIDVSVRYGALAASFPARDVLWSSDSAR